MLEKRPKGKRSKIFNDYFFSNTVATPRILS